MEPIAEKVITQIKNHPQIEPLLTAIAKAYLRIETLQARDSDSLDFYSLSAWEIREALAAAFQTGVQLGASVTAEIDRLNAPSD